MTDEPQIRITLEELRQVIRQEIQKHAPSLILPAYLEGLRDAAAIIREIPGQKAHRAALKLAESLILKHARKAGAGQDEREGSNRLN